MSGSDVSDPVEAPKDYWVETMTGKHDEEMDARRQKDVEFARKRWRERLADGAEQVESCDGDGPVDISGMLLCEVFDALHPSGAIGIFELGQWAVEVMAFRDFSARFLEVVCQASGQTRIFKFRVTDSKDSSIEDTTMTSMRAIHGSTLPSGQDQESEARTDTCQEDLVDVSGMYPFEVFNTLEGRNAFGSCFAGQWRIEARALEKEPGGAKVLEVYCRHKLETRILKLKILDSKDLFFAGRVLTEMRAAFGNTIPGCKDQESGVECVEETAYDVPKISDDDCRDIEERQLGILLGTVKAVWKVLEKNNASGDVSDAALTLEVVQAVLGVAEREEG